MARRISGVGRVTVSLRRSMAARGWLVAVVEGSDWARFGVMARDDLSAEDEGAAMSRRCAKFFVLKIDASPATAIPRANLHRSQCFSFCICEAEESAPA